MIAGLIVGLGVGVSLLVGDVRAKRRGDAAAPVYIALDLVFIAMVLAMGIFKGVS